MADATTDFLNRLDRDQPVKFEMLPPRIRGTVRFDIEREAGLDHWFITMDRGAVRASRTFPQEPDATIRASESLFDRLVQGKAQIFASLFRNEISVEGDLGLATVLHRLFPAPPGARHPRSFVANGRSR